MGQEGCPRFVLWTVDQKFLVNAYTLRLLDVSSRSRMNTILLMGGCGDAARSRPRSIRFPNASSQPGKDLVHMRLHPVKASDGWPTNARPKFQRSPLARLGLVMRLASFTSEGIFPVHEKDPNTNSTVAKDHDEGRPSCHLHVKHATGTGATRCPRADGSSALAQRRVRIRVSTIHHAGRCRCHTSPLKGKPFVILVYHHTPPNGN